MGLVQGFGLRVLGLGLRGSLRVLGSGSEGLGLRGSLRVLGSGSEGLGLRGSGFRSIEFRDYGYRGSSLGLRGFRAGVGV